ncbi:MAG TPA: glycosyl hydrolase [Thermomicrobiales bacterium]|nr:glycosyl hydrolase [Thermomicrobiales bacterium]
MTRTTLAGRIATILLLVVVAAGLLPSPLRAADTQDGNPFIYGIAAHAWWLDPEVYGDQLFPALDDLNVTTVRLSIDWRRFEPVQGQFDWRLYDAVFGELAKRDIVIVADFNTIPGWASVDKAGCDNPGTEIYLCGLREDMAPAFRNAIRAAVSRYAWVEHWEFWNEPEMWQLLGQDAAVYLRNLRVFYDEAHAINPEIVVAAQTLVGADYMDWTYNLSAAWYGAGNEPWDAISIHPYNWGFVDGPNVQPEEISYWRISQLRDLMVSRGDTDKPIWITEYGWVTDVENQARNLRVAIDWMKRQPYIEFAHLHMLHDWNEVPVDQFGLMGIVPDEHGGRWLGPDTKFAPKPVFYDAFKNLPRDGRPGEPWDATARLFPETGQAVDGRFLRAWEQRGGLRILGLPLSRPYPRQQPDGRWLLVQDFERARLEFHPEYLGGWGEVLGTLAGSEMVKDRLDEGPFHPLGGCAASAERACFDVTGHSLSYGFKSFWEAHGGLATFGYPISEEFSERNADTGEVYTVQYFERARFEYHPEYAGTEYEVLLGRLIANELATEGWLFPGEDSRLPTARMYR